MSRVFWWHLRYDLARGLRWIAARIEPALNLNGATIPSGASMSYRVETTE